MNTFSQVYQLILSHFNIKLAMDTPLFLTLLHDAVRSRSSFELSNERQTLHKKCKPIAKDKKSQTNSQDDEYVPQPKRRSFQTPQKRTSFRFMRDIDVQTVPESPEWAQPIHASTILSHQRPSVYLRFILSRFANKEVDPRQGSLYDLIEGGDPASRKNRTKE